MAIPLDFPSATPSQLEQLPNVRRWGEPTAGTKQLPVQLPDPANPNTQSWDIGLTLEINFLSSDEEAAIIDFVATYPNWTGKGNRITIHFGSHFDYTTFATSATAYTPPPTCITDLLPRLPTQGRLPDQFTIQYYPPGTGIAPHVDTHSAFDEAIYSISIGCEVPMTFKKCGETEARRARAPKRSLNKKPSYWAPSPNAATVQDEVEAWDLSLPPRSLLIMKGPARYNFTHRIKPRSFDWRDGEVMPRGGRLSITMRTVRRGAEVGCYCSYPEVCDTRIQELRRKGLIDEDGNLVDATLL